MSQRIWRVARRTILPTVMVCAVLTAGVSIAANVWDGGATPNANWSAANNWDNNLVPAFPAQLTFAGAVNLMPNNDLGNIAVDGIIFDAVGGAFSIGGQAFTLGNPATADYRRNGITNNNALLQTIANNFTLTRGQHVFQTTSTGGLTLSGSMTRSDGSGALFVPLAGTSIKTTLSNGPSGLIGAWATITNPTPDPLRPNATAAFFAKVDGAGNVVPYGDADYTADNDIDGDLGENTLPAGINANSNIRWRGAASSGFNIALPTGVTNLNTFLFDGPQTQGSKRVEFAAGSIMRFTSGGGIMRANNTGTNTNVAGVEFFANAANTIEGDYNNDGHVDAADYVVWRKAGPSDFLPNDPTPGVVDGTDYSLWKSNFGKTRFGVITAGNSSTPAELVFTTNTQLGTSAADPGEQHNRLIELINTVITDNPEGGKVTVIKNGPGAVRTSNGAAVSGANHTFSGGLYLNRGVWRSDNTRNASGENGAGFGLGPVYVASGAQAFPQTDQVINNDFFISGTGIDEG